MEAGIALLERCIWFYLSYDLQTGGSAYEWFQMTGPHGAERVKKIDGIAKDILYGDALVLNHGLSREMPQWLEELTIDCDSDSKIAHRGR